MSNSIIKITAASENDVALIADFQILMALETENLKLDKQVVVKGVRSVFDFPEKGKYYTATLNGEIIASLLTTYEWSDWRNSQVVWIQSVFVKKEFRRQGVFSQFYSFIKNRVETSVGKYCGIRLYVDKTNTIASQTYQTLGMQANHYKLYEDMV